MKKTIIIILTLTLLSALILAFAGCSNQAIDDSKAIIDEYYDNFRDYDTDDIVDLFDDTMIDDLGNRDDAEIIMLSRIATLGEDVEYNIIGTSYSKDNDDIMVIIEVEATYERDGEMHEEIFQLENIDDEMIITGISLDSEKVIEDIVKDFFDAYNKEDEDTMYNLFADAFYIYASEEVLFSTLNNYSMVLGEYQDHELTDEYAYYSEFPDENMIVVHEGFYDVEFENGTAKLQIQLCLENDKIKINFLSCMPEKMKETIDEYFYLMSMADYDGLIDMYTDVFYENTDGGKQTWIEILEAVNGYGDYAHHEITEWEYIETELDDTSVLEGIIAGVSSQFGDTMFYNVITILNNPDDNGIIYHTIELEE